MFFENKVQMPAAKEKAVRSGRVKAKLWKSLKTGSGKAHRRPFFFVAFWWEHGPNSSSWIFEALVALHCPPLIKLYLLIKLLSFWGSSIFIFSVRPDCLIIRAAYRDAPLCLRSHSTFNFTFFHSIYMFTLVLTFVLVWPTKLKFVSGCEEKMFYWLNF